MSDFISAAIGANREVSRLLKEQFDPKLLQKREQGAGGDISSEADILSESIFVKYLGSFGTIESEESGIIGEGEPSIIIDPLDGSSNFSSGFPYYGTSVAMLDQNGMLEYAIVCNLVSGELFIKSKDALRYGLLQSDLLTESKHSYLPEIGIFEKAYAHPAIAAGLLEAGYKFRSPGAVALSLAYAARSNFFLFVGRSRIYDIVAGLALCEGLEVVVEEEYVIVSHKKDILKEIETIVSRSIV